MNKDYNNTNEAKDSNTNVYVRPPLFDECKLNQ